MEGAAYFQNFNTVEKNQNKKIKKKSGYVILTIAHFCYLLYHGTKYFVPVPTISHENEMSAF
jgi:hypothetical protein